MVLAGLLLVGSAFAQEPYLSNLNASRSDPLFATYAAPIARSNFIVDEGYRFSFYHKGEGVRFSTDHSGDLGMIFHLDGRTIRVLEEMHREPVITTSYSDLVHYTYWPTETIRVDAAFQVYSSSYAIHHLRVANEGSRRVTIDLFPFLHHDEGLRNIQVTENAVTFEHTEVLDDWMQNRRDKIPYIPERKDILLLKDGPDEVGAYASFDEFLTDVENVRINGYIGPSDTSVVAFHCQMSLAPGEHREIRLIRGVVGGFTDSDTLRIGAIDLLEYDMELALRENEQIYSRIPALEFADPDVEMMYWSAFNLIRHLFMAPEGKMSYNHYVYSREPTWGWGYAGQVLHESITMLAYVFMDPESAEDSQRLYMERQWDDGFIYYRVGPYLDEYVFTRGDFTSSAPWFNWENWEIYLVSGNRVFLQEAYESGTRFYNWWIQNRDADRDGLAEWGGHAVLESIRDAKVALWRDIGWPSNFESPDLNAMLVSEARALANIARELGNEEAAALWTVEADSRAERIRQVFWDEEDGFFYHVDRTDNDLTFEKPNDLKRREIVGFLPMWAGVTTREQAERLIKDHLTDPDQFWRTYGIPSLSATDPFYEPQGYWNGPVWVELNYLVFRGLLDYGYVDLAREMASRIFETVIHHLKTDHTFWEFYSPDELWGGHHQTYIWTGIVARMLIDLDRAG